MAPRTRPAPPRPSGARRGGPPARGPGSRPVAMPATSCSSAGPCATPCWVGRAPTWTSRCHAAPWPWPSESPRGSGPRRWCSTPSAAPPGWPAPACSSTSTISGRPAWRATSSPRDFTVNALAVPLELLVTAGQAPIVDPTGGLEDLRRRRLRPAGPGVLADDPLRPLRAVRLEATLGLRLTPAAVRLVRAAAPALGRVSVERVRDELVTLLRLPATGRALRRAEALGLLAVILPEIAPDAGRRPAAAASLQRARALPAGRRGERPGAGAPGGAGRRSATSWPGT